jgi:hypothetical protein
MSLFIHNENQNLLWNIISKSEPFARFFNRNIQYNPNLWFRNIIQKFYNENTSNQFTKDGLNQLNREVLKYMVDDLKTLLNPQQQQRAMEQPIHSNNNSFVESREEMFSRQFDERQKEYNSLLAKPVPPTVDFGGNIKDEAISNMDDLIRNQMKQREEELKHFSPPHIDVKSSNKLKIDDVNIVNIDKTIVELDDENKSKKSVSWAGDKKDIEDLKIQVQLLTTKVDLIQTELESLRNTDKE